MTGITVDLTPELVDVIAKRVVELMSEGPAPTPDRWLRGAMQIADHIDAPVSRVYALAECTPSRIPVERDGSRLIARCSDLDRWIREGGGKTP